MASDIKCRSCHSAISGRVYSSCCPGLFCERCLSTTGVKCVNCGMEFAKLHPAILQTELSASRCTDTPIVLDSRRCRFDQTYLALARVVVIALTASLHKKQKRIMKETDRLYESDVPGWVGPVMAAFPCLQPVVRRAGFQKQYPATAMDATPCKTSSGTASARAMRPERVIQVDRVLSPPPSYVRANYGNCLPSSSSALSPRLAVLR